MRVMHLELGWTTSNWFNLRHSAVAMLIELGTHPKLIQTRLGHSDISTTMNTYGHLMPGQDRGAADQIGHHLGVKTG